jgi:uncharacterized protein
MATRLPELIEPLRLAEKGVRLGGEIELSRMSRLDKALGAQTGQVSIDVLFSKDENGVPTAQGAVKARLKVLCQRCMEPMTLDIEAGIKVELSVNEEAIGQDGDYESLFIGPGPVSLVEFVEDELILALPIAPRHPEDQCPSGGRLKQQDATPGRSANPFAALSKLKLADNH